MSQQATIPKFANIFPVLVVANISVSVNGSNTFKVSLTITLYLYYLLLYIEFNKYPVYICAMFLHYLCVRSQDFSGIILLQRHVLSMLTCGQSRHSEILLQIFLNWEFVNINRILKHFISHFYIANILCVLYSKL